MHIKILGSGCLKCVQLEKNTKEAFRIMGIHYTIEKVTQLKDIVSYGVLSTPALVVDEYVKSYGKVLSPQEIVALIKK